MSDYPGAAWLARYRERVNGDAELKVIGDWFTTTFGLTFGDSRYAVRVEKGQITDIVTPKLDTRTPFGFRAPVRYGASSSRLIRRHSSMTSSP